ncbi:hypothetical protein DY000_02007156 [Brassica cretica]|uniref:Uncharacterized protein n=1 Tax=Brassica cretica TaxID=69181 RepID=A0ABQ7C0V6_BRACR|nr:hypothetical protein DY000_02007156 [Brassica cretica]
MALLVHHACPEGCPDVLASVPDPLMDFSHPYSTKAWKLSCLKTCLTPVHILVMKINWRVMWSVRRLLVSKRNCQLAPRSILNLDQVIQSELIELRGSFAQLPVHSSNSLIPA